MLRRFAPLTLLLGCSGCIQPAITGSEINAAYLDRVVVGSTTKADVLANLGAPPAKFAQDDGASETWAWSYESTGGGGPILDYKGSKLRTLRVSFEGDVVSDCMLAASDDYGALCSGAPRE